MADEGKQNEAEHRLASMFDGGLLAYKSIPPETYGTILQNGLVVLDTNTLLDLYRYHENTRHDFLQIYAGIGDNLWIPYHVMFEFFERRADVIDERASYMNATVDELQGFVTKHNEKLAAWANRMGLSTEDKSKVVSIMEDASVNVIAKMRQLSRDDSLAGAVDTSKDPVLKALEPIVDGRVGRPLPAEDEKAARAEARRRIAEKIPPGFMDAGKKGANAEGDYLIWYETVREAKRRGVDVLFITGDQKQDWWRIEKGQLKGPRRELVAELETEAGKRLYMLRPASLAEHVPDRISEESVRDARRVSSKASIGWHPRPGWGTVRNYVEVANDQGGVDLACRFIFDDGSDPLPMVFGDQLPIPELGEYARGIYKPGEKLEIKVGAEGMTDAEDTFQRINSMEPGKRALMFMDSSDVHADCGWAWTPEYKLVKAAPGLVDEQSLTDK